MKPKYIDAKMSVEAWSHMVRSESPRTILGERTYKCFENVGVTRREKDDTVDGDVGSDIVLD